jgi:hypothetical protein
VFEPTSPIKRPLLTEGIRGILGVEVGRGRFQRLGEDRQAFLRLTGAHRFLLPPIPHLLLRLKVSIPGIVGVVFQLGKQLLTVLRDIVTDPSELRSLDFP